MSVGLVAGDGGAAFWPLLTPIMRSREYLFTGDRISPALAVEFGLASRTCPPDELLDEARKLASKLAKQPSQALQGTKRVLNMYLSQALSRTDPGRLQCRGGHDAVRRAPRTTAGAQAQKSQQPKQ